MRREFTANEIAEIEANPNTYEVTGKTLRITSEAKEKILLLRKEGHSAKYIFKALGYHLLVFLHSANKFVKATPSEAIHPQQNGEKP